MGHTICGFNLGPFTRHETCPWFREYHSADIPFDDETKKLLLHDEIRQKAVVNGTRIMAAAVHGGFEFNFKENGFPVAPVIYGGYTIDGNVVGVITSRVWT